MDILNTKAHAKINWTLDVLGSFEQGHPNEGFTKLSSVMFALELHDSIEIKVERSGASLTSISCNNPQVPQDSTNSARKNTAYLAVETVRKVFPQFKDIDVQITIEKKIPIAGGLGGSSTDGSATLRALSELLKLNLTSSDLASLAASFGSDTPFFASNYKAAIVEGRGEEVKEISHELSDAGVVCINPGKELHVAEVFKTLKLNEFSGCAISTGKYASANCVKLIREGASLKQVAETLSNDLVQSPAVKLMLPSFEDIKSWLLNNGCLGATLSGSGPTIFGVTENFAQAQKLTAMASDELPGFLTFATVLR